MSIEYKCKNCPKEYSTYKSLWRHNALKHKDDVTINSTPSEDQLPKCEQKTPPIKKENEITNNNCNICNKLLANRHSRWRHEQNCKNKNINEIIKKEIEKSKIETQNELSEYKKEIEKLKDIIQKSLKIHPQTLKKINNTLNNNNTNNGIINNNNITYVQLGNEDLVNVLSKSEKRGILNRRAMGINDLVELIHCSGKYKQFMNVYITNLQNTVAYRYDKKTNNFIVVNKNELLDEIIDSRIYDITKFLNEAEKVLEPSTAADIKRIIKTMETDDSFKGLKKEEIKFILYNNKDKIITEKDKVTELEV